MKIRYKPKIIVNILLKIEICRLSLINVPHCMKSINSVNLKKKYVPLKKLFHFVVVFSGI